MPVSSISITAHPWPSVRVATRIWSSSAGFAWTSGTAGQSQTSRAWWRISWATSPIWCATPPARNPSATSRSGAQRALGGITSPIGTSIGSMFATSCRSPSWVRSREWVRRRAFWRRIAGFMTLLVVWSSVLASRSSQVTKSRFVPVRERTNTQRSWNDGGTTAMDRRHRLTTLHTCAVTGSPRSTFKQRVLGRWYTARTWSRYQASSWSRQRLPVAPISPIFHTYEITTCASAHCANRVVIPSRRPPIDRLCDRGSSQDRSRRTCVLVTVR